MAIAAVLTGGMAFGVFETVWRRSWVDCTMVRSRAVLLMLLVVELMYTLL